jgi:hypothetical protein
LQHKATSITRFFEQEQSETVGETMQAMKKWSGLEKEREAPLVR